MSSADVTYVVNVKHAGTQTNQKITLRQEQALVIGRSWKSDIVVNDEYMDPSHVRLSLDSAGHLHVEDLDTKNGTRSGKKAIKDSTVYDNGDELQLGDSTVAIFRSDASVKPATRRDTVQRISRRYHSVVWYVLSTLIGAGALSVTALLLQSKEATNEVIASVAGVTIFIVACASFIGGLLSKLFRQKALFGLHYLFACWVFALYVIVLMVWDIAAFNINQGVLSNIVEQSLFAILAMVCTFGLLSLTTRITRYKRIATAAVMVLLPTLYDVVTPLLETEHNAWTSHVSIDTVNQPPVFQFKSASSVGSYLQQSDTLFTRLKKKANWDEQAIHASSIDAVPANSMQVSEVE